MKVSLEGKISIFFGTAVLVLLAIGVAGWWNAARFDSTFRRVDHTHKVLGQLSLVLTDVLSMQTSTRGFVLTGSETMLEPYEAGTTRLGNTLQQLRQLTTDNPGQQQQLDQLEPLTAQVRTIMAERVAARRTRGLDSAQDTESFLRGQQLVNRLRAVVDVMAAEENRLLHERFVATQKVARANLAALTAVGALTVGVVIFTGMVLRRDLLLRRRAEAALRSSETRYRTLFSSLDEGFCVIEMIFDDQERPVDYRFLEISPSFEKQTGLRDAVGKRMRELAPLHEAHWFETYGRVATTGEAARFQNRAEQLHRWYDVYAFRFGEPKNRQVAILFNDITQRKVAEVALTERTTQLETANKELEAFSYSVSHDLRAPLRHIHGFAGLLEKHSAESLDERGHRYVTTIREAALQMGRLIDDLLAFSRVSRTPLALAEVDHDALLAGVVRDGRYEADGRAINWEISPLPRVRADVAMLRQVWVNLIDNAVKYSRGASPAHIAVSCHATDGATPEHVFSVHDNGVGFDPAYAGKLFGVFQRLHDSTQFEGTGIGLANVRRIVTRHGGRTWAEGEAGNGATFFFSLPRSS